MLEAHPVRAAGCPSAFLHPPCNGSATQARAVKGEVGPSVVSRPLDLHRPLLHKIFPGWAQWALTPAKG